MSEYSTTYAMEVLGVYLGEDGTSQMIGDCPFCGKEEHFYANKNTGQWDCKICGESGNLISFMTNIQDVLCDATSDERYEELHQLRHIPTATLKAWGVSWVDDEVLIPIRSETGKIHNYRRWNPKTKEVKSLPGCKAQLFGTSEISQLTTKSTIWLCEGEWDAMILSYILEEAGCKNHRVAAVPGANTFKDSWAQLFQGHDVILCYDYDEAGTKGSIKATGKLRGIAKSLRCIKWPENSPDGYDIRDYWIERNEQGHPAQTILWSLEFKAKPIDELTVFESEIPMTAKSPLLTPLSEVEPEDVTWLWDNRIPMGKLSMIAGDPGLGKSFLTLYIAAIVSRGTSFPDIDTPIKSGFVILLSAEDGLADTIRPRLDAAKADSSKIVALKGIQTTNEDHVQEFDLTADIQQLERAIQMTADVRVIIIDPITAYMGNTDSHKNADVRNVLAPLSSMAERHGLAVIAVTHLNKKGTDSLIYRTMGSLAFIAAARSAWYVTRDKDDQERRLFLPIKTNLSVSPTAMAFRIVDGAVEFESETFEFNPDDELPSNKSQKQKAIDLLLELLKDGPANYKIIWNKAKKSKISDSTLKRAKNELGIQSTKSTGDKFSEWHWSLPDEKA